jgi:hypothetical protein
VLDFPCLAECFEGFKNFLDRVARRIPVQPIQVDLFNTQAPEAIAKPIFDSFEVILTGFTLLEFARI